MPVWTYSRPCAGRPTATPNQTVSELLAIGAPTRLLLVPLMITYSVLMIAFDWGVWVSAGRKRALRVVAGLLVGLGVMGFTGPFTSMHQRELRAAGGGTLPNTLHKTMAGVGSLFFTGA
jgi:hypothetical protein